MRFILIFLAIIKLVEGHNSHNKVLYFTDNLNKFLILFSVLYHVVLVPAMVTAVFVLVVIQELISRIDNCRL